MKKSTFIMLCLLAISSQLIAQVTLIPYGSSWNYVDNGSNLGTAWRTSAVSSSPWKVGAGKFGYGVDDITTPISFGINRQDKHVTTYFTKIGRASCRERV